MSARTRTLLMTCVVALAFTSTIGPAPAAEGSRSLATQTGGFSPYLAVGAEDPVMSDSLLCWWDEGVGNAADRRMRVMDLNTCTVSTVKSEGSFPYERGTSVDSSRVVWTDRKLPSGSRGLYGYDAATRQVKRLGDIEQREEYGRADADARPDVSGDRVVVSGMHGGQLGVWLVSYSAATWEKLGAVGKGPRISGEWAVWLEEIGDFGSEAILVVINVATRERRTITVADARGWDIDDGTLVYAARRQIPTEYGTEYEDDCNLYGMDLPTGATFTIWSLPGTESNPRISGSIVAWEDEGERGEDDTRKVHFKSLSTGIDSTIAPGEAGATQSPTTNGTQVAWIEGLYGAARLRCAAIADRAPTSLTISAPKIITFGVSTQVRGRLTDAGGTPLGGRMIRLNGYYSQRFNSGLASTTLASVRTGDDGVFAFAVKPLTVGHYVAQFVPGQTDNYGPSTSSGVQVAPRPKVRLSVPKTARAYGTVNIFAYVYAAKGFDGPTPQLQGFHYESGKWVRRYTFDMGWPAVVTRGTYKGWTLSGDRAFATERNDFKRGRWRFRVVIDDPDYAKAVSSWYYLTAN